MTLTILAKFLTNRTTIAIGRLDLVDASKFVRPFQSSSKATFN